MTLIAFAYLQQQRLATAGRGKRVGPPPEPSLPAICSALVRRMARDLRSILITANQPFSEWGKVFPDPTMTLAAVDRLVHHATIIDMNVESYRRRVAFERKRGPGRPPTRATTKTVP